MELYNAHRAVTYKFMYSYIYVCYNSSHGSYGENTKFTNWQIIP